MVSKEDIKNPNLKHNKALFEARLIFGVPSKLFLAAFALVIGTFISAGWIAGIVVFLVFIPPLIMVHRKDEKGLVILFDKLKRPNFYSAGAVDEKSLKVIQKNDEQFLLKRVQDIN